MAEKRSDLVALGFIEGLLKAAWLFGFYTTYLMHHRSCCNRGVRWYAGSDGKLEGCCCKKCGGFISRGEILFATTGPFY